MGRRPADEAHLLWPADSRRRGFTLTYDGRDNLTSRRMQSGADDITTNLTYDLDDLRTGDGPFTFTRGGALGELTRVDDDDTAHRLRL